MYATKTKYIYITSCHKLYISLPTLYKLHLQVVKTYGKWFSAQFKNSCNWTRFVFLDSSHSENNWLSVERNIVFAGWFCITLKSNLFFVLSSLQSNFVTEKVNWPQTTNNLCEDQVWRQNYLQRYNKLCSQFK